MRREAMVGMLLALAILASAGVGPGAAQQGATAVDAARLTSSEWLAEDIRGGGVIDNARSSIAIAANGALTGSAACNRLIGRAKVEGSTVLLGPLATSRMACPPAVMDQERKFLAALEAARTYRFDGALLRFHDAGGAEVIRFTQVR